MDRRVTFPSDFRLMLASQSPRRHSLLRDLGVPFTVVPSRAEERLGGDAAPLLAEENAMAKVQGAVLPGDAAPGDFLLATDTLVTSHGWVMGKPASPEEAARMLSALSGGTHQVVSGVALTRLAEGGCIPGSGRVRSAYAVTDVTFMPLDEDQIGGYLASGEWRGKAGAYAIQGLAGLWVSGLRGEYSNVVGLPLCLLGGLFRAWGFDLLRREWLAAGQDDLVTTSVAQ
jgi:septum formation protein